MKRWIEKIKIHFSSRRRMMMELITLRRENEELKERVGDPREVINRIFSKAFSWYDWNDLPFEERKILYAEAQLFVNSPKMLNIRNFLVATGSQETLMAEGVTKRDVRDFQMIINGIELFFKELERIYNPMDDVNK